MTYAELRAKFNENVSGFLALDERDKLAAEIGRLEELKDASTLVSMAVPAGR